MKKLYILLITFFITASSFGQLSINEIYYSDSNDFVELKGPAGFNLTGWTLNLYSSNQNPLGVIDLSTLLGGVMPGDSFQDWNLPQDIGTNGGYALLLSGSAEVDFIAFGTAPEFELPSGLTSTNAGTAGTGNSLQMTDAVGLVLLLLHQESKMQTKPYG